MIIYKAENIVNGKAYIGKTVRDLEYRQRGHIRSASKGSNTAFHSAIRKYGCVAFIFSVVKECESLEELNIQERLCITSLNTMVPNGYNLTPGGDGQSKGYKSPMKGVHFLSEEAKRTIREKRALQVFSQESIDKRAASLRGSKRTAEQCQKMSELRTGMKMSEEFCRKIGDSKRGAKNPHYGKLNWNSGLTKEVHPSLRSASEKKKGMPAWNAGLTKEDPRVAKYAESLANSNAPGVFKKGQQAWNKGIPTVHTEEANAKRSATMAGKPKSDEVRANMVAAQQKRRQNERMFATTEMNR